MFVKVHLMNIRAISCLCMFKITENKMAATTPEEILEISLQAFLKNKEANDYLGYRCTS